jgi:small subunit ribosomal protein S17
MENSRQTRTGVVVSNQMRKTIVVRVSRMVLHPKYKKYIRRHTRLYAHDERGECQKGDRVAIVQTRPFSKLKRWRLLRKL